MKVVICLPTSDNHYLNNEISYIGEYTVKDGLVIQSNHYGINLVEVPPTLPSYEEDEEVFVYNKKLFDRFYKCKSYDLETQYWLMTGLELTDVDNEKTINKFRRFYKEFQDYYRFIPYSMHIYISNNLIKQVIEYLKVEESSIFYRETVYKGLSEIEKSGLFVDMNKFNTVFAKQYYGNFVYCNYNLHTTTGRPSNNFDNVNFSALNKKDETRECFISRFNDGRLIEFDFDAYHIRLIGNILGYEFPEENLHSFFGKQYFNSQTLTEEQYKESKTMTFKFLYSTVAPEFSHIEFFKKVESFKIQLWNTYQEQGYIQSPVSKRKIARENTPDLSKAKLFNYLLQAVETEVSMIFIKEVIELLNGKSSKLVLYTYDSFLIDFTPEDGKELLQELNNLIKHAKIKIGRNYKDLNPFSL